MFLLLNKNFEFVFEEKKEAFDFLIDLIVLNYLPVMFFIFILSFYFLVDFFFSFHLVTFL